MSGNISYIKGLQVREPGELRPSWAELMIEKGDRNVQLNSITYGCLPFKLMRKSNGECYLNTSLFRLAE